MYIQQINIVRVYALRLMNIFYVKKRHFIEMTLKTIDRICPRWDTICLLQVRPERTNWMAERWLVWSTRHMSKWPSRSSPSCVPTSENAGQPWSMCACTTGLGETTSHMRCISLFICCGQIEKNLVELNVFIVIIEWNIEKSLREWIWLLRWVEVGQASIVMAISSPHRHDGQQAIQHCINQLKAKIPIWKKVKKLVALFSTAHPPTHTQWVTSLCGLTGSVRHTGLRLEGERRVLVGSARSTTLRFNIPKPFVACNKNCWCHCI